MKRMTPSANHALIINMCWSYQIKCSQKIRKICLTTRSVWNPCDVSLLSFHSSNTKFVCWIPDRSVVSTYNKGEKWFACAFAVIQNATSNTMFVESHMVDALQVCIDLHLPHLWIKIQYLTHLYFTGNLWGRKKEDVSGFIHAKCLGAIIMNQLAEKWCAVNALTAAWMGVYRKRQQFTCTGQERVLPRQLWYIPDWGGWCLLWFKMDK